MTTYKVKVGVLTLTESRDVSIPQEVAAWHQTVRVEPGAYDVYAYLDAHDHSVRQLSASAEGVTVSSSFRSRIGAHHGARDNNRNGQRASVSIELATYGRVGGDFGLLAQANLSSALSRTEWEPRDLDPARGGPRMWRFEWTGGRVQVEPGQQSYQCTLLAHPVA